MISRSLVKHYLDGAKVGCVNLDTIKSLIMHKDSFKIGHYFKLDYLIFTALFYWK